MDLQQSIRNMGNIYPLVPQLTSLAHEYLLPYEQCSIDSRSTTNCSLVTKKEKHLHMENMYRIKCEKNQR